MEIISLTLIPFLISMASFPTMIKAPSSYVPSGTPAAVYGGGARGINPPTGPGYMSGEPGPGFMNGGPGSQRNGDVSPGYRYSTPPKMPVGGGDPGAAIVVFPKKPIPVAIPPECKSVAGCTEKHIAGDSPKAPQRYGKCCKELKNKVSCVCKFLMSKDTKQQKAADGVLRGCHFTNPICVKKPMPPTCRAEVKHCVEVHIFGIRASKPTFRSPCCQKFKTSKKCIMAFKNSPDPQLSQAAKGVIEGCRFT